MSEAPYQIRRVEWAAARATLGPLRAEVFIQEQGVPPELEWDGLDEQALHFAVELVTGETIATARLLRDGHIGRVAVARPWRGRGVGRALLSYIIVEAGRLGMGQLHLAAQVHALEFYRTLGFSAEGEEFLDAGIPHRAMHLTLP